MYCGILPKCKEIATIAPEVTAKIIHHFARRRRRSLGSGRLSIVAESVLQSRQRGLRLMRFLTVADARQARTSVLVATVFITVFYTLLFVLGFGAIALILRVRPPRTPEAISSEGPTGGSASRRRA